MKRLSLLIACAALALAGCASNDYALYAKGQAESDTARHNADAAKYKAMADIAAAGTESAKVAAVMALALGAQGSTGQGNRLQAPQASSALQWAQVLVPGLTQIAGIAANMQVATTQSNNAARVAESTNASFVGIASQIQAAPTITTTTTTDRHDVVTPAPVVVTPVTPIVPTVIAPTVITPTVIQPVVQVVPIVSAAAP